MKKAIAIIALGLLTFACTDPQPDNKVMVKCRIKQVELEYPHGGVLPDKRYRITTCEGYVVYSYNQAYQVGDSINVQIVNLSNQ